jgi:hypothetical protein
MGGVMQVFRSIQDDDLVRGIAGATRRMVFVAPGVSAAVAKALEICLARHPVPQIMIVLRDEAGFLADDESLDTWNPDGFSAPRLAQVVEQERLWRDPTTTCRHGLTADEQLKTGVAPHPEWTVCDRALTAPPPQSQSDLPAKCQTKPEFNSQWRIADLSVSCVHRSSSHPRRLNAVGGGAHPLR